MTLPADRCRRTDDRCRWSQAGDDGGCPLKPASPQIERLSHHNRICRGDPQPRPRDRQPGSLRWPLLTSIERPTPHAQIPIAPAAPACSLNRGFLPWRLSDPGPGACLTVSRAGIRNPSQKGTPVTLARQPIARRL
jgi:hypothetical protein